MRYPREAETPNVVRPQGMSETLGLALMTANTTMTPPEPVGRETSSWVSVSTVYMLATSFTTCGKAVGYSRTPTPHSSGWPKPPEVLSETLRRQRSSSLSLNTGWLAAK
jgi:hypothetical protein